MSICCAVGAQLPSSLPRQGSNLDYKKHKKCHESQHKIFRAIASSILSLPFTSKMRFNPSALVLAVLAGTAIAGHSRMLHSNLREDTCNYELADL